MKFSNNAQAALQQSDTRTIAIEMTEERKEKFGALTADLMATLRASTESPLEAYMVIQFLMHSFEDTYGIRGGVIVEHGDKES